MNPAGEARAITPRPCRSCGVEVYDLTYSRTGKTAPIEARVSANGNVLIDLEEGIYTILSGDALEKARTVPVLAELHVNHFTTCPQARSWRQG